MAKLSQKENFMLVARRQQPEYVPVNAFVPGRAPFMTMADPAVIGTFRSKEGGYDPWGVHFVTNEETGFAAIPEPGNFILKDVRKWRDVIHKPDFSGFDWEKAAREDREKYVKDPTQTMFTISGFGDLFQQFIGMMGFTEGLCALYEETDEVAELLDYMLDVAKYVTKNVLDYYKPEGYYLLDDSASKLAPFMSPDLFKELFVPRYKQILDMVVERDIPIFYHNCGRCEDFLEPMVEIGVAVWDPAQVQNDLKGIHQKFGCKLAINGGYEYQKPPEWPNVKEEDVRKTVYDKFMDLAPGGGFIFSGMVQTLDRTDPMVQTVNGWIRDEAFRLSEIVYK
ncbi:MAG: veratrol--corrinoid protein metyltransferase [Eubacteriaceae bacterium]|nr:veratrol--corrinoid protein metyltransferase [Eubacteriaceae bacterium]